MSEQIPINTDFCGNHKTGFCSFLEPGFGKCEKYVIPLLKGGNASIYLKSDGKIHIWNKLDECKLETNP